MTNRVLNLSVATLTGFATTLIFAAPSRAADYVCTGAIGAITVDNLIVPDNATCTLNKTRVNGGVELGLNASLTARGVAIVGNVQGDAAKTVTLTQAGPSTSPTRSQIGGNVELQNNSGVVTINAGTQVGGNIDLKKGGAVTINATSGIAGDIIIEEHGGLLKVNSNSVRGSVQINKNTGGAQIRSNRISGNLQCQDNLPAPTGALNQVFGNKEDQCVAF